MAEGLNRAMLFGALGADPELRVLSNGNSVLGIRLATTERVNRGGEWQDHTEWHSVTVWGARGEALSRILRKGDRIFVEGSLTTRSWEGRDGNKRYKTEINAKNVLLAGSPRGQGTGQQSRPSGRYSGDEGSQQGSYSSGPGEAGDDEDYGGSILG